LATDSEDAVQDTASQTDLDSESMLPTVNSMVVVCTDLWLCHHSVAVQ